jgi:signal transduction histidine kinase
MKYIWIGIALLLFFGCVKHKNDIVENDQIYVSKLIDNATNRNIAYNKRIAISQKLFNLIYEQENDSINRERLILLSYNFLVLNDLNEFKKVNRIAFQRSLLSKNKRQIGICNRYKGIYFETKSNNDSAFYYYLKAEKLFKKINDFKQLCLIYQDKAQVQFFINDYLGSEASLIEALKIAKQNRFIEDQFLIFSSLGVNSNELYDFSKSFNYHFKALQLLNANRDKFDNTDLATCYNNIGYNYFSIGDYDKAINFYEKGISLKGIKTSYPYIFCKLIENAALSKLKMGLLKSLDKSLIFTQKIRNQYNIDQGKNFNRLYLSYYYAAIHDLPKANAYALEALAISKNFKAPKDQLLCLKQLIKINPQKALDYGSQYISLSDSMQNMERQSRNKFAKIAFETDEITKEKEEVEEQYTIILWVCLAIFTIAVLLIVIGKQLLKQKEFRLQQVQQKVNEEIYNLLLAQQNKIDAARNNEKERISKDLHDGVLNRLASTRMNLDSLHNQPTSENVQKSKILIDGIQDVEKEIRNISHDLNKEVFAKSVSFVKVISTFMEDQFEATKTRNFLEFDAKINWDLIPGLVKIHLYRIVQEAVHNINKHARAQSIIINFLAIEGGIKLEIFDDGVGFLLNKKKKGIGLQNIYSRTASCNGTVLIESQKGIGTTLKLFVPYQE